MRSKLSIHLNKVQRAIKYELEVGNERDLSSATAIRLIRETYLFVTQKRFVAIDAHAYIRALSCTDSEETMEANAMKTWSKPQVHEQEVGLEVTSYLPAEIDII